MRKEELIHLTAKKSGCSQDLCGKIVNAFLYSLNHALLARKNIEIRNFGTFKLKKSKPFRGQDMVRKIGINVPAKWRVRFILGSKIRDLLNKEVK